MKARLILSAEEIDHLLFELIKGYSMTPEEERECFNKGVKSYKKLKLKRKSDYLKDLSEEIDKKTGFKFTGNQLNRGLLENGYWLGTRIVDGEKEIMQTKRDIESLCAFYLLVNDKINDKEIGKFTKTNSSGEHFPKPYNDLKRGEESFSDRYSRIIRRNFLKKSLDNFDRTNYDQFTLKNIESFNIDNIKCLVKRNDSIFRFNTDHETNFYKFGSLKDWYLKRCEATAKYINNSGVYTDGITPYLVAYEGRKFEGSANNPDKFTFKFVRGTYSQKKATEDLMIEFGYDNPDSRIYEITSNQAQRKEIDNFRKFIKCKVENDIDKYLKTCLPSGFIMNISVLNQKLDKTLLVLRGKSSTRNIDNLKFTFGIYETMREFDHDLFNFFNRSLHEELNLFTDHKYKNEDGILKIPDEELEKSPKYVSDPIFESMHLVWSRGTVVIKATCILRDLPYINEAFVLNRIEESEGEYESFARGWIPLIENDSYEFIQQENPDNYYKLAADEIAEKREFRKKGFNGKHKGFFFQAKHTLASIWRVKIALEEGEHGNQIKKLVMGKEIN